MEIMLTDVGFGSGWRSLGCSQCATGVVGGLGSGTFGSNVGTSTNPNVAGRLVFAGQETKSRLKNVVYFGSSSLAPLEYEDSRLASGGGISGPGMLADQFGEIAEANTLKIDLTKNLAHQHLDVIVDPQRRIPTGEIQCAACGEVLLE